MRALSCRRKWGNFKDGEGQSLEKSKRSAPLDSEIEGAHTRGRGQLLPQPAPVSAQPDLQQQVGCSRAA